MSAREQFFALAEANKIEVQYRPGGISKASAFKGREPYPAEFLLDSPLGKIFCSSGCHSDNSLCHEVASDGTNTNWSRAYAGLQEIIRLGLETCPDTPNCDICDEPEEGWESVG